MPKKIALLFGSTGLVGFKVLENLINDDRYEKIVVFLRKSLPLKNDKINLILSDFSSIDEIKHMITGSDLFCCLGTTLKKAGSLKNFKKTDFELVVNIAKAAHENGVPNFLVISSVGAKSASKNYYLRTKGQMEEEILKIPFRKQVILRPSFLLGKRKEFRLFEAAVKPLFSLLSFLFIGKLKKYRPNKASDVATLMVKLANVTTSKKIFEPDDINLFCNK